MWDRGDDGESAVWSNAGVDKDDREVGGWEEPDDAVRLEGVGTTGILEVRGRSWSLTAGGRPGVMREPSRVSGQMGHGGAKGAVSRSNANRLRRRHGPGGLKCSRGLRLMPS